MKKTGGDRSVKEQTELFCMQYMMRRDEVYHVADVFSDALEEDHQKNADMFDIGKMTFSNNPHPNATMRALEQELADKDLPFLHLLFALLRVGADLVLALADFEAPTDFANAAAEELKSLRKQLTEAGDAQGVNQRQAELRRTLNEAESRIRANQPEKKRPEPTRGILVGDTVELLKLGTKASVIGINKDGSYQLQAGILKMNAKADEIYLLEHENPYKQKAGRPAHSGREMKMAAMSSEVDLRGMDSVEAICVLERYLDEAMRSNLQSVRIIHGKGTGTLRAAVQQALRKNKFVKKFRLGVYGEGEDGVTIAEFG